ncbi:F-box/LRR-repeat protein At5g02910-like [Solanum tuberosum]|uniref:F-box/LRR-repeat protein At5g02910-like n=1 Tax=Solanum tuberosum TaxID=4113 RepID=UPI00073A1138|nr:PREDICTED: F-box/LRR-repeat protein At5g02910-like [Solanum tuberosum]
MMDRSPRNCAKTDKIEVETGTDWISALPNSVIVEILCKIPITDACTTTILSKRWQNMWTCIHDLNCYRSKTSTGWSAKRFISFIDNALPLLTTSKIEGFTLHFRSNIALSNYSSKLNKWLQIVLKKKVENLHLDLWYYHDSMYLCFNGDRYSLPQDLCSSSSLLNLKCQYCRIPEDRILNWTSLKSLTLTSLLLSDEHMKQITSNCHHLESLKLCDFCGFHRLHLTSPNCTRLELSNHTHPLNYMGDECYFEIVAPYVQHLKISGDFVGVEIRLGDLSSLIHADLTYHWYDLHGLDDVINKSIVKDHLTSVACANDLIISSLYIEMISMLILQKEDVPLPLLECKRLTINSWTSKYTFFGIDRLLSSTPCLENLTIHLKKDSTFLNYWCEDMDMLEDIFEGSLRNLKILKVILQWSLFINHITTEQTKVMKYLLERAKNLEKLVIVPTNSGCSKMIKSLLALPTVSNTTLLVSVEPLADVEYE